MGAPLRGVSAPGFQVEGLGHRFGETVGLDGVALAARQGEILAVVGPSGCGKTTLLRAIAGFIAPQRGRVLLGGQDVTGWPAHRRGVGVVFQSYALFPTRDVAGNVGFGLALRGAPRAEIAARVAELLDLVGLSGLERRHPHQLSGGQQQRVALARALAPRPGVLLLDEPLSALDAQVRVELRTELGRILRATGVAALHVTHDQEEALALADRVAVMQAGRVLQVDTPRAVYLRPASRAVAGFVGRMNFLPGRADPGGVRLDAGKLLPAAHDLLPGTVVSASLRPEHVVLLPPGQGAPARVVSLSFTGATVQALLHAEGSMIEADLPPDVADGLAVGDTVGWRPAEGKLLLFAA
jgi:putative spermidine/putrescine transport system ATP-binding protein